MAVVVPVFVVLVVRMSIDLYGAWVGRVACGLTTRRLAV